MKQCNAIKYLLQPLQRIYNYNLPTYNIEYVKHIININNVLTWGSDDNHKCAPLLPYYMATYFIES